VIELNDKKIVLGLILLQIAVTLPFINSIPIDLDEPFSIFYAQQDLNEFIPFLNKGNNPPLHFILLHYWMKIFGIGSISVRSLSLLFSLLTIPVLYHFGKKIVGQNYSVLFVGFFIFSTFNHFHALEARVYSLMVLLSIIAMTNIYKLLFTDKRFFIQLAVCNVSLLYTHYLAGLIIIVELLLLLLFYKKITWVKFWSFIISGLITTVLYIPGLIQFYKRFGDFSENGTWVSAPHITELYGNIIRFFNHTISFVILISLLSIFMVFNRKNIFINLKENRFSEKERFVFYGFGLPYLLMYLFSVFFQPIFLDRYLLFTTPLLFLSFIIFIKFVLKGTNKGYPFLFILPMVISCYYVPQTNRDGDELANFVKSTRFNSIQVAICPPFYDLTFIYHYDKKLFIDYKDFESKKKESQIQSVYSFNDIRLNKKTETLYFIDANLVFLFPDNDILIGLNKNYSLLQEKEFFGGYKVYEYSIND
jgi:mannosyltransferase